MLWNQFQILPVGLLRTQRVPRGTAVRSFKALREAQNHRNAALAGQQEALVKDEGKSISRISGTTWRPTKPIPSPAPTDVTVVDWKNTGHWLMEERPEETMMVGIPVNHRQQQRPVNKRAVPRRPMENSREESGSRPEVQAR